MAKEVNFDTPPRGHFGQLVYDAVNDRWIAQRATLWTYDDRWVEDFGGTKSGDGSYTESSTAVPAGEVWVLEHAFCINDTGARGAILIYATMSAVDCRLVQNGAPAQAELVTWTGRVTLKEGDVVKMIQYTCLNGDVISAAVCGYKMKVPQ
jgi:hypothetical protein